MKFSSRLWEKINPFYQDISVHPFNLELVNGTLSRTRFNFFIMQDIAYLKVLEKVFSLIAKRATSAGMIHHFTHFSTVAQSTQHNLQTQFLTSNDNAPHALPSPACCEYSDYLMSKATLASLEEAIAAVLPCFWIYRELSNQMNRITALSNPYLPWIAMNCTLEQAVMTDQMIDLVDEVSATCSDHVCVLMGHVCERSSHFEWRFWDDAYKMLSK